MHFLIYSLENQIFFFFFQSSLGSNMLQCRSPEHPATHTHTHMRTPQKKQQYANATSASVCKSQARPQSILGGTLLFEGPFCFLALLVKRASSAGESRLVLSDPCRLNVAAYSRAFARHEEKAWLHLARLGATPSGNWHKAPKATSTRWRRVVPLACTTAATFMPVTRTGTN